MPIAGFEPTISAGEGPQIYAIDRAATGTGSQARYDVQFEIICMEKKSWFIGGSGLLTLRRLMSYIYGAPILDVSRSHTTTQHSR